MPINVYPPDPRRDEDETESFEVVDVSEAGIDVTPPSPGAAIWNMEAETWDEFIARTRRPVTIRDGVRDTRSR